MPPILPPGPKLRGVALGVPAYLFHERYQRHLRRRFGDRVTLDFGRLGRVVALSDPDDVRAVFRGDADTFHAGEANAPVLGPLLGAGSVLVTDGAAHRRQRRLLAPPFHGANVARLVGAMADVTRHEVAQWPVGRPFKAAERTQRITFEVILRTVVGATDPASLARLREVLPPMVEIDTLMMLQFAAPRLRRVWPWSRFAGIAERADAAIYDEIAATRRDPALDERDDVLAMLVRSTDEGGAAMGDAELRDQIVTLLLAGHETTATGLAWALERLTRHPEALAAAVAAADEGDDAHLDAVVAETLRVRPVVAEVGRVLTADASIRDLELPAGTTVNVALSALQRDERRYPDAERFDPGRFLGNRPDASIWMPFGGGNRRCIGAAFAQTEMRVVLAEVLRGVELETTTARGERARPKHVTMVPAKGAMVTVRRRRGPLAAGDEHAVHEGALAGGAAPR